MLVVVLAAGTGGSWALWQRYHQGQAMRIPGDASTSPFAPWPAPAPGGRGGRRGRRS